MPPSPRIATRRQRNEGLALVAHRPPPHLAVVFVVHDGSDHGTREAIEARSSEARHMPWETRDTSGVIGAATRDDREGMVVVWSIAES